MKNEAINRKMITEYHALTELGRRKYVSDHLYEILSGFQTIKINNIKTHISDMEGSIRKALDKISDDIIKACNPDYYDAAQIIDGYGIDFSFPKKTEAAAELLDQKLDRLDDGAEFVFASGLDESFVMLPVLKQGEILIPFEKLERDLLSLPVDVEVPVIKYFHYKPAYTSGPPENREPEECDVRIGTKTVHLQLSDIIYDFYDFIYPNTYEEILKQAKYQKQEIEEPEL